MRLYVVRHSVRTDQFDEDEQNEVDPGLTPEGKDIVVQLARWMADKDEVPSIVYASPMVRTQETAEILVKEIGKQGYAKPSIITDVGIGPGMSIRAAVLALGGDKTIMRPCIVSHHESISNGLKELNHDVGAKFDQMAMSEMRILKIRRKSGLWEEHRRVLPSDLGMYDYYE